MEMIRSYQTDLYDGCSNLQHGQPDITAAVNYRRAELSCEHHLVLNVKQERPTVSYHQIHTRYVSLCDTLRTVCK